MRDKVGCGGTGIVLVYVGDAVCADIGTWVVVLYVGVGATMLRRDGVALGVAVG